MQYFCTFPFIRLCHSLFQVDFRSGSNNGLKSKGERKFGNMDNNNLITPIVQADTPKTPNKKTGGTAAKIVVLALCCSLVGGAAGAGGVVAANAFLGNKDNVRESIKDDSVMLTGQRDQTSLKTVSVDTNKALTDAELYAANVNSTVGITTSVTTDYFGYPVQAEAAGSGFIITSDGYILTNCHVVEGATSIKVTTYGNETYDAELIGCDADNDIAVLKINAKGLTPVVLGDSDQLNVGDSVVAIGNPLGQLSFSLTSGSVSALNRNLAIKNMATNLIQTDCAINSGNSGGALFNSYGEVIGITNAKYSGSSGTSAAIENIGFAIPINSVRDIVTSIIEKGYIEKTYIGITAYTLSGSGMNTDLQGAVVYEVEGGSPAEKAGLQEGDVITAIDGKEIEGTADLSAAIAQGEAGDRFVLTINRDGETLQIKVKLGVRCQSALPDETNEQQQYPSNGDQEFPGIPGNGQNPFGENGKPEYNGGDELQPG